MITMPLIIKMINLTEYYVMPLLHSNDDDITIWRSGLWLNNCIQWKVGVCEKQYVDKFFQEQGYHNIL